jgi:hypothetical protein
VQTVWPDAEARAPSAADLETKTREELAQTAVAPVAAPEALFAASAATLGRAGAPSMMRVVPLRLLAKTLSFVSKTIWRPSGE